MKKITSLLLLMVFTLSYSNTISYIPALGPESPSCITSSTDVNDLHDGEAFSKGYNLTFETLVGGEVKISCELLDTKIDLVAFLFKKEPFVNTQMTQEGVSQIFSSVITGQTNGSTISYAVKFSYAGGQAVTKYVDYVVGQDCELGINDFQLASTIKLVPNPVQDNLRIETTSSVISKVEFYSLLGHNVLAVYKNFNSINVAGLTSGIYMVKLYTEDNKIAVKKLIIK